MRMQGFLLLMCYDPVGPVHAELDKEVIQKSVCSHSLPTTRAQISLAIIYSLFVHLVVITSPWR